MKTFKIATWNVNSLRTRLAHLLQWIEGAQPDVIALQETKTPDEYFPIEAIKVTPYFPIFFGQKAYNGVAIFSTQEPSDIVTGLPGFSDEQRRLLGATIGNLRVLNVYVPNGQHVSSEKFQYKLAWLQAFIAFLKQEIEKYPNLIILGDFNIAPQELDIHDPKLWEGQVLFSAAERQAFQDILQLGFIDVFRKHAPEEKAYSWWDYRLNALKRDLGARIDHILISETLVPYSLNCKIDKTPRLWERSSDHTPVIAEFGFNEH